MKRLRPFGLALWLAFALVMGQQAVLLHDLGHAFEQHDDGAPAESSCNTHFACAQLASAVGASPPIVPQAVESSLPALSFEFKGASQRTRLAYRSQAPPSAPA